MALVAAGVGAVGFLVATRRQALARSLTVLGHLHWAWVPAAVVLEWSSIAVFARMQRRLLAAGGVRVGARTMLATVLAANALATSLPLAGPELGTAFTFRRFKRQGVDPPVAGWALMVGGILSPVAGSFLFMTGALLSGNDLLGAVGVLTVLLGVAVVVLLHLAASHPRMRRTVGPVIATVVSGTRRLRRRPAGDPAGEAAAWFDRLGSLHPPRSAWPRVGGLALANWLTDAGVFAVSLYAVGSIVPWHALLLIYGSAIVVGSLGITPGGLGLVEGTLCVGLVGAGVHVSLALAAVLLYRFISFWIVTAAGWVVFLCLRAGAITRRVYPSERTDMERGGGPNATPGPRARRQQGARRQQTALLEVGQAGTAS